MSRRKLKAHLGRSFPARSRQFQDREFVIQGDGKAIHIRQLWSREGGNLTVSHGDLIDFAIGRRFAAGERIYTIGLSTDGLWVRADGELANRIISFDDLFKLISGQGFLPNPKEA